jgi:hypothetical protein
LKKNTWKKLSFVCVATTTATSVLYAQHWYSNRSSFASLLSSATWS